MKKNETLKNKNKKVKKHGTFKNERIQKHGKNEKGATYKGYLNVLEDIRIEKHIKSKYAGLREIFYDAYGVNKVTVGA